MTTTIPAPITLDTACPAWCTEHEWLDTGPHAEVRHQAPTKLNYPPEDDDSHRRRRFTVTPELWAHADGTTHLNVYIQDDGDGMLTSGAEIGQLVAALLKAGQKAFGDTFSAELANSMFPAPDRR